jgi:LysM repeat protein
VLGSVGVNRACWPPVQLLRRVLSRAAVWAVAGLMLLSLTVLGGDQSYVVKRGDTLYGVARSFGLTATALAERNGLSRSYHLYPGQRLIIPGTAGRNSGSAGKGAAESIGRVRLPRSVQQGIEHAPVRPGRWQMIVIHHSGVDTGTVKAMDKYHREVRHMENGLAYDFVIGNGSGMGDGEIAVGRRWTLQLDGGHLASEAQNRVAIGICLVGNFEQHRPSPRQLESLRALVEALMSRCRLSASAVKTHQQINVVATRCPGARFPTGSFLGSLQPGGSRK